MVPGPDLPTVHEDGGGAIVDHPHNFLDHFDDGSLNGIPNSAPPHLGANIQPEFSITKLTPNGHPPRDGSLHKSLPHLNSNGAFWPPLKAIPLASYYKVHRVPSLDSLTAMAEEQDGVHAIELPQSEPSHVEEPQEKLPPNGVHNKILENVIRTPGRQPSPQPTHLSVPGSSQHRVLPEQGSGYVAPKFEGKEQQMDQGERQLIFPLPCRSLLG